MIFIIVRMAKIQNVSKQRYKSLFFVSKQRYKSSFFLYKL